MPRESRYANDGAPKLEEILRISLCQIQGLNQLFIL